MKPYTRFLRSPLAACALALAVAPIPQAAVADAGVSGPAPSVFADGEWAILAGSSLKSTLESWARVAGWTLIWDSPMDYRVRASASFGGRFEESAARLIDFVYIGNPELTATFHRGNRVLHIQDQPLATY